MRNYLTLRAGATASLWFSAIFASSILAAAELTVDPTETSATVKIDGKPFAEYVTKSNSKPIVWPIYGPTGKLMTRSFPMKPGVAGEEKDHPWHRSLWFTHGAVNHVDFWDEGPKCGSIVHRKFLKTEGGKEAVIVTANDWIGPKGNKECEDERTLTFGGDDKSRWIDFDVTLKATVGPIDLGDTKEGSFGVRVPSTMRMESKKGGQIVNSVGQTGDETWGRTATWVDYHGPIEGEELGIAILNHPVSYGFPTRWHVRGYGLFAANPFGRKDFPEGGVGGHHLEKGESLRLRYRVIFHEGDEQAAHVADAFEAYAKDGVTAKEAEK